MNRSLPLENARVLEGASPRALRTKEEKGWGVPRHTLRCYYRARGDVSLDARPTRILPQLNPL